MHKLLHFASWYYNMCEAEAFRFRDPKTVVEEEDLVDKAIPTSTKYKNKWAVTIFNEWQTARKVQMPVLDCGGMFKDYDLVGVLSTRIEDMDALCWNYWLNKFVMEVAKKSGERYLQTLCMASHAESDATLKRRTEVKD